MSRSQFGLIVSGGLALLYLALTAWMKAHGVEAWASSGAAGFCGFGILAVLALSRTGRC